MPTGYTAEFESKDLSFSEFVWRCSRAMGAFMHMREDGLDAQITMPKLDSYHKDAIKRAEKELKEYEEMNLSEAAAELTREKRKSKEYTKEVLAKHATLRDRYTRMLAQVKAWNPPSKDHENFKKFMMEQLESSLKFDCDDSYYISESEKVEKTPRQWLDSQIKMAKDNIVYHTKKYEEDQKRHKELIAWITDLQNSVPLPGNK